MPELLTARGIAGLGAYLPETVVTTAELAERHGVEPGWITSRTGIEERRYAAAEERLAAIASHAARAALEDAGVEGEQVDLVLVATCSPDELVAPAAAQVAAAVGAHSAGAVDLGAACTGFVSGLAIAAAALESGRAACVLLVGAEVLSRMVDPADRKTAALFGDGAGAAVLTSAEGIGPVVLGSDARPDLLFATRERGVVEMDGAAVFQHAVERMAAVALELGEADRYVFHQANARILAAITRRLGLPPERVVNSIARHGNTSAASIPLALASVRGELRPGDRVLLAAFGAGFTWGGTVIKW